MNEVLTRASELRNGFQLHEYEMQFIMKHVCTNISLVERQNVPTGDHVMFTSSYLYWFEYIVEPINDQSGA